MNRFLLYSFVLGIYITFIYDVIRIFRRVFSHKRFLISIEDFIFWIYCTIVFFYLCQAQSDGNLRWFAVFGAVTGMLLYKITISKLLVQGVSFLLIKLKLGIRKLFHIITKPLRVAAKPCVKAAEKTKSFGGYLKQFLKKRLTQFKKMLKMILCKQ